MGIDRYSLQITPRLESLAEGFPDKNRCKNRGRKATGQGAACSQPHTDGYICDIHREDEPAGNLPVFFPLSLHLQSIRGAGKYSHGTTLMKGISQKAKTHQTRFNKKEQRVSGRHLLKLFHIGKSRLKYRH